MISSAGIGSGLNVDSIIRQLMALERRPLNRLEQQKSEYAAQLSAYGTLKSAVSDFESAMRDLDSVSDFKLYSATSSDDTIFTATASSDAAKGTYDIEVTNLAQAHKIRTASGFADGANFNSGTLTIERGADSFSVVIDSSNNTLSGIRDAINSDTDNPGVTASIINDGTSDYLTLTSDDTGASNTLKITSSEDGTITGENALSSFDYDHVGTADSADDTGNMTQVQAFEDAQFTVDGLSITSASNTVEDAIQGVTLTLLEEDVGTSYTLDVQRDTEGIRAKVQGFVDAYNALQQSLDSLQGSELSGDNALLSIQNRIRNELNTTPSSIDSSFSYLSEIGVSIQKDGTMALDSDEVKLEDALNSDFNGVAELFGNNDQGYAHRLRVLASDLLAVGDNAIIEAREDGINDRIDSIDDRIASMERRLELTEERYRAQYTALDTLVGQLQTTSNYLTQQLSGLNGDG